MTVEQAKALRPGAMLYHVHNRNADGSPQRWRVSGQPKTWKTRPNEVVVPIKHGLYDNAYMTELNVHHFYFTPAAAAAARSK